MTSKELRDYAENIIDTDSIVSMENGNKINGFYLTIGKLDFFIVTDRKNKTDKLASDILRKLLLPNNPDTRKEVLYWTTSATCRKLSPGTYYNVKYNNSCFYTNDLMIIPL